MPRQEWRQSRCGRGVCAEDEPLADAWGRRDRQAWRNAHVSRARRQRQRHGRQARAGTVHRVGPRILDASCVIIILVKLVIAS